MCSGYWRFITNEQDGLVVNVAGRFVEYGEARLREMCFKGKWGVLKTPFPLSIATAGSDTQPVRRV